MKMTKAQFAWLRWLQERGGAGMIHGRGVIAQGEISGMSAVICWLHLLSARAVDLTDAGRIVITEYGKRLLSP